MGNSTEKQNNKPKKPVYDNPSQELENLRKMVEASYVPKPHYTPEKKDDFQSFAKSSEQEKAPGRKKRDISPDIKAISSEPNQPINISRKNLKKPLTQNTPSVRADNTYRRNKPRKSSNPFLSITGRILLCILTVILFAALSAYAFMFTVAHGPSETARNTLVLNAKQNPATEWIPNLVLKKTAIDKIVAESNEKTVLELDFNEYFEQSKSVFSSQDSQEQNGTESADDKIALEIIPGASFKTYLLFIKEPSQIFTGVSGDDGMTVFQCAEKYGCLAAINAGMFSSANKTAPAGLTYSEGQSTANDDITGKTFIGFDMNNKLIVSEDMTQEKAAASEIRDAVSAAPCSILIDSSDGTLKINFYNSDTSTMNRSAIGQCADGTVIFLVTEGNPGATKNDIVNILEQYGAVNASLLEGGNSSALYYRDYVSKYNINKDSLSEFRKSGMINDSEPVKAPTYFVVREN